MQIQQHQQSLPTLDSIDPKDLKNYSKEELGSWLHQYHIRPKGKKPELKRQLRALIECVRDNDDEGIATLQEESAPVEIHNDEPPRKRSRYSSSNYMQNLSPNYSPSFPPTPNYVFDPTSNPSYNYNYSNSSKSSSSSGIPCLGPRCKKKSNKECEYQLCRGCCSRKGNICTIHQGMSGTPRRNPNDPDNMFQDQPENSDFSQNLTRYKLGQNSDNQGRGTEGGGGGEEAEEQLEVEECKGCGKKIVVGGSNVLIHLNECNKSEFWRKVWFGGTTIRSKPNNKTKNNNNNNNQPLNEQELSASRIREWMVELVNETQGQQENKQEEREQEQEQEKEGKGMMKYWETNQLEEDDDEQEQNEANEFWDRMKNLEQCNTLEQIQHLEQQHNKSTEQRKQSNKRTWTMKQDYEEQQIQTFSNNNNNNNSTTTGSNGGREGGVVMVVKCKKFCKEDEEFFESKDKTIVEL